LADGSTLPSWLSFDTTAGILSGTPLDVDVGVIDVMVTATDSAGASVSDGYTLTVNNTSIVDMNNQPIQVRNMESITKAQTSIDKYGADITGGDTSKLIRYELWLDASALSTIDANATGISWGEFNMDINNASLDLIPASLNMTGNYLGFYGYDNDGIYAAFNSEIGKGAFANSTAVVDTDTTNDEVFNGNIQTQQLIGTFYVNPINAIEDYVDIVIKDMILGTDAGTLYPDNYTTTLVDSYDSSPSTAQLIQIRNPDTIILDNDDKIMKFELWLDATELSLFNAAATEIRGYQFDINWNDLEVGALNLPTIAGTNVGFNAANPDNSNITFNSTNGMVAYANWTAVVYTDPNTDGPFTGFIQTQQLIGTFYINPYDNLETMSLSIDNMMIVTDTNNISPADYTSVLEISNMDATIQTDAANYLDNISLDFFKDGVDTGTSILVENGKIIFPDVSLDFDAVKLSDASAYTNGVMADDAVDVLRDIVHLDELVIGSAAWHAADVNNDGVIAADDAVAILRHIVQLDTIDTFDLIDNTTGNRITTLDANAIDVGQWSIVANGDVDQSGGFGDAYMVQVDIV